MSIGLLKFQEKMEARRGLRELVPKKPWKAMHQLEEYEGVGVDVATPVIRILRQDL